MASRPKRRKIMASRPKRTNGVVAHVTEQFGLIDLTNKNIPIPKVYFDFTSFGGKGGDLTKIYPRGTNVSFTFIASTGEHNVKHKAINLTKINPQKVQGSQGHGAPTENSHTFTANKDQNHHGQQSFKEPRNQSSNVGQKPHGGKPKHKGGQGQQHQQPHYGPPHGQYSNDGRRPPGGTPTHVGDQGHGHHHRQPHYGPPHGQHSNEGRNPPGGKSTYVGDQGHGHHHQPPHYGPPRRQYSNEGRNPPGGRSRHVGDQGHGYAHQQPHHGPRHSMYPYEGRDFTGGEPVRIDSQGRSNPHQHHGPEKFQKPHRQRPHRQDSHESDTQGQRRDSGATYPHDQSFVPQPENLNIPNPGAGQFLREPMAPGLNKMTENFIDQPATSGARYSAAEQPTPPGELQVEVARKGSGSEQGNREKKRKESQKKTPKKAFNDSKGEAEMKKPLPCSEDSEVNIQHAVTAGQFTAQPVRQLAQESSIVSGKKPAKKSPSKKDKLFQSSEVKTFMDLLGKELSLSWKNKLKSLGLKTLNNLLLLRLTVGKKAGIRVVMEGETSNHTIEDAKSIELEDLQRLLRNNNTVKSHAPLHYGVKGTLHSIRSIEQNGKLTGLTLFFQLHEIHDGLGLEIVDRKGFTGVVSDVRSCPQKYIYNYLRCKSQEMAKTKDVLVLDVDGQLSGCDDCAHASLGDVTRIACSSSSELTTKITEAIEHLHECVVVIGVDSTAILQALQKMVNKGASVLAGISPDMKAEVETTFAE